MFKQQGDKNKQKKGLKSISLVRIMIPVSIIVLSAFFAIMNPKFLTLSNLSNIARQSSVIAIAALGQTIVLISGGFDLSQGSVIGLVSCIGAAGIIAYGIWGGTLITLAVVAVIGLLMGFLVAKFRIPAFIVTLGMLTLLRGATLIYTNGMPVAGLTNKAFLYLGSGDFLKLPVPFLIAVAIYILGYIFLTYTRAGRDIYAVGGNEDAALISGVSVDRRKILAFIISAVCAGIAGLILTSRIAVGQPTLGEGYELKSITAAIIGGTSLYGGAGTVSGTALGVILVAVIGNGLNLLKVSSFVQLVINGAIIIIAVGIDVWQKRSKK